MQARITGRVVSDHIRIDLQQIKARALDQSFERGESLYERGAVFLPVQRGNAISAQCVGADFDYYHVSAEFDEAGEFTADCTCPYDWGGDCKHIVAMLLTYLYQPARFRVGAGRRDELMSLAKDDLVDIIEQMVTRYLGLEDIVEGMINEARKEG